MPFTTSTVSTLYNSLPLIHEANKKFVNRDQIFAKLAPLLSAYDNQYGVCLVHRHCKLEEGEMMVASTSGMVSQPERNVECYPERWLATGEPYEFTRKPTRAPPQKLLEEFQKIVQVDGVDVLGLFYIQAEDGKGGVNLVERTEGRTNIMEILPFDENADNISTAWCLDMESPVHSVMKCSHQCNVTHHPLKPEPSHHNPLPEQDVFT